MQRFRGGILVPLKPTPDLIFFRLRLDLFYPVLADSEPDQKFRVGFAPRQTYPAPIYLPLQDERFTPSS